MLYCDMLIIFETINGLSRELMQILIRRQSTSSDHAV
jgi:hypothetical protein